MKHTTVVMEKFGVKKLHKAHTYFNKFKTYEFFYYDNFTFEYLVHASSFHSPHSCMPNVCDNNVYEAQMCTLFYYLIPVVLICAQDNGTMEVL